jgi:hypothetical protein
MLVGAVAWSDIGWAQEETPTPLSDGRTYRVGPSVVEADVESSPAPAMGPIEIQTKDLKAPAITTAIEAINFDQDAANNSGFFHIPPDPIGAAGPNHVLAVVNTSIFWSTKAGTGINTQSLSSFFSPLNPVNDTFDPKCIYDQHAGRFVVVTLEQQETASGDPVNSSRILVAVSDDSDPNGTWHYQAINSRVTVNGTDSWADYPGLAVDDKAIYLTANMFPFGPGNLTTAFLWIVHKTGLYSGGTSTVTRHDPAAATGQPVTTMQPAHIFGTAPAGVGTWLVRYSGFTSGGNESISVFRVNDPLGTPAFVHNFIPCGDIDNTSIGMPDAPQLGATKPIDTGDRRLLHTVWRSNSLYAITTVVPPSGVDAGQATAHWFHVNTTSMSLADQGNVGGEDIQSGAHTYWASIGVNAGNAVAMGFALSGSSTYAGAYYTSRLASDAPGTVSSTAVLAAGLGPYTRTFTPGSTGSNRWGDYSGMSVDPADDVSFWVFNEYALTPGTVILGENGRWGTRFGKFTVGGIGVSMTSATADSTAVSPIPVTATFTESVSGFTLGDIVASNATVSGFSGSGAVYSFNLTPTAEGIVTADIPAGAAQNGSGTPNLVAPQFVREYDLTPPGITFSQPDPVATKSGPVDYTVTYSDAESITLVAGDVTLDRSGTVGGGAVTVLGSGNTTRTVRVSSVAGNGTMWISLAAGTATDLAGNVALAAGPSDPFAVDNLSPVNTLSGPSSTSTGTTPVSYTVSYVGADIITLSPAHVTLNRTGTANGVASVSGTGTSSRTISIGSLTGQGTIGISVAAGTGEDLAGNTTGAMGPSATFSVDAIPPSISIGSPSASVTNTGPVSFTVNYAGASTVTLVPGDVTLNTTGNATGAVSVTGTGALSRTVTISSITGDGSIGISIAAGTAADSVGNLAPAAGPSATFNVDNTPPTVSIGAPSVTQTTTGPVSFPITYSGASSVTLNVAKVILNTTGTATGNITVTGSGTTSRTVTLSGISGEGTLGISLQSNTAVDAAGNPSPAAGPSATLEVDGTPITVNIGSPSTNLTKNGPVEYTVTYENVSNVTLAPGDITLNRTGTANGTVSVTGAKADGTLIRTVTIGSTTGTGTIGISIASGTATDMVGKTAPSAGPSATFSVDNTPPAIAVSQPTPSLTDVGPVSYTVTYTGASSITLSPADITLISTGTASGAVSVSGSGTTTRTVTISAITGTGTLSFSIAAGTATDSLGNVSTSLQTTSGFHVFADLAALPLTWWPLAFVLGAVAAGVLYRRKRDNGGSLSS